MSSRSEPSLQQQMTDRVVGSLLADVADPKVYGAAPGPCALNRLKSVATALFHDRLWSGGLQMGAANGRPVGLLRDMLLNSGIDPDVNGTSGAYTEGRPGRTYLHEFRPTMQDAGAGYVTIDMNYSAFACGLPLVPIALRSSMLSSGADTPEKRVRLLEELMNETFRASRDPFDNRLNFHRLFEAVEGGAFDFSKIVRWEGYDERSVDGLKLRLANDRWHWNVPAVDQPIREDKWFPIPDTAQNLDTKQTPAPVPPEDALVGMALNTAGFWAVRQVNQTGSSYSIDPWAVPILGAKLLNQAAIDDGDLRAFNTRVYVNLANAWDTEGRFQRQSDSTSAGNNRGGWINLQGAANAAGKALSADTHVVLGDGNVSIEIAKSGPEQTLEGWRRDPAVVLRLGIGENALQYRFDGHGVDVTLPNGRREHHAHSPATDLPSAYVQEELSLFD